MRTHFARLQAAPAVRAAGGWLLLISIASAQTFGPETVISTTANGPTCVEAADINGDGLLDIVAIQNTGNRVTWIPQLPGGEYGSAKVVDGYLPDATRAQAADMDGDLDIDLVVGSHALDSLVWYENVSGGLKWTKHPIPASLDGFSSVTLSDINMDGALDILVTSSNDNKVSLFENLKTGDFAPQLVLTSMVTSAHAIEAADLNGDGCPDILVSGVQSFAVDSLNLLLNHGDGTFGPLSVIASASMGILSMTACDLDQDGDLDVFATLQNKFSLAWFENDGAANFSSFQILFPEHANQVRVADADMDGDLDLFASSSFSPFNDALYWYEGVGDGSFLPKATLHDGSKGVSYFALADLDGDGDLDVVSAAKLDDTIGTYEMLLEVQIPKLIGTVGLHCVESGALVLHGEHLLDTSVTVDGLPVPVLGATESELTITLAPDVPGGVHTIGLTNSSGATDWPGSLLRYPILTGPDVIALGAPAEMLLDNGDEGAYSLAASSSLYDTPAPFEAEGWFHGLELNGVWILRSGLFLPGATSLAIPLPVVNDPGLAGSEFFLQAWTYQESLGHTGFTAVQPVTIQ